MERFKFYFWLFTNELWNKRWVFLPLVWIFSAIAIFVVFLIPDQYRTRAGIYIDTDQLLAQVLKDTTYVIDRSTQSQAQKVGQMIYSTDNLRKVLRSISPNNYNLSRTEEALKLTEMAAALKLNLGGSAEDYYEISYVHKDPVVAYNTLKTILDMFIETNIRQMSSKNDRAASVSEDSLKIKQKELAEAQADLAKFKQKNIELSESSGVLLGEMQRMKEIVRAYPSQSNLLQSKLTSLTSSLSQTQPKILSGAGTVNSACDFSEIEKDLASARSRGLTELHPDVIYYTDLLARKKQTCNDAGGNTSVENASANPVYLQLSEQISILKSDIASLNLDYKEAKSRILELQNLLNRQPVVIEKLRILEARLDKASDALKSATSSNDIIRGTIDLNRKSGLISYEVIEQVQMPLFPEKPNRLLLLVGAFLSSLIAAMSYILVKFKLEQRMSTIGHLREAFDLPVLGSITIITKQNDKTDTIDVITWVLGFLLLILVYGVIIQICVFSRKDNFDYTVFMNFINKILQLFI